MLKYCLAVCISLFAQFGHSAVWEIVHPQSPVENDERFEYPIALLKLALDKTGVRYEVKTSLAPMRQARALKRLEENLEINLMWSMTDIQREEELLPIRIPITKGLIGWRMFLVHADNALLDKEINELEQLLEFKPVQGVAWPDTKILQANGFNVVTARDFLESRALMLENVADFFPRSVIEIRDELRNANTSRLKIKRGLALTYPTAMYYFVNKRNKTLAKVIETGLRRAIEDGSFNELFKQHFSDTFSSLDMNNLQYFELTNPLLPLATPLDEKSFWYRPE